VEHPDVLLDLFQLRHQDQIREVENWRLAMTARPKQANFVGRLLLRLLTVARQRLPLRARSKPVKPDLAGMS
jgi:hypothetical protein